MQTGGNVSQVATVEYLRRAVVANVTPAWACGHFIYLFLFSGIKLVADKEKKKKVK